MDVENPVCEKPHVLPHGNQGRRQGNGQADLPRPQIRTGICRRGRAGLHEQNTGKDDKIHEEEDFQTWHKCRGTRNLRSCSISYRQEHVVFVVLMKIRHQMVSRWKVRGGNAAKDCFIPQS